MTLVLVPLLATMGASALLLIMAVIFTETGLLVGFALPGDSLLFAAGVFTAAGVLPLPIALVIGGAAVSAVAGDQVAFRVGRRLGPRLFTPGRRRPWSTSHVVGARRFFERHGHKAVVLARFVPLARTFTPVVAGAVTMPARRFTVYNVVGGLAWSTSMLLAGFYLGGVPLVAAHVELTTVILIVASMMPAGIAWLRSRLRRDRLREDRVSRDRVSSGNDPAVGRPARTWWSPSSVRRDLAEVIVMVSQDRAERRTVSPRQHAVGHRLGRVRATVVALALAAAAGTGPLVDRGTDGLRLANGLPTAPAPAPRLDGDAPLSLRGYPAVLDLIHGEQ